MNKSIIQDRPKSQADPRGGDRREALLAAATALFAERGYDGTTVERIAQRAGANKAMVSYYFGGKAGLYTAIVRATFEPVVARLEPLRTDPRPAPARLRELVRAIGEAMSAHPGLPAMLLREVLSGGRQIGRELLPLMLAVFGTVATVVAEGVREGSLRSVNPLFAHLSVVGSLLFFFGSEPFRRRLAAEGLLPLAAPLDPAAYVDHVEELMARGFAPSAPSAPSEGGAV